MLNYQRVSSNSQGWKIEHVNETDQLQVGPRSRSGADHIVVLLLNPSHCATGIPKRSTIFRTCTSKSVQGQFRALTTVKQPFKNDGSIIHLMRSLNDLGLFQLLRQASHVHLAYHFLPGFLQDIRKSLKMPISFALCGGSRKHSFTARRVKHACRKQVLPAFSCP